LAVICQQITGRWARRDLLASDLGRLTDLAAVDMPAFQARVPRISEIVGERQRHIGIS